MSSSIQTISELKLETEAVVSSLFKCSYVYMCMHVSGWHFEMKLKGDLKVKCEES